MVLTKFQPALVLGAGYTTKYQVDPIYKVHWFQFLFELHSKTKAKMINVGLEIQECNFGYGFVGIGKWMLLGVRFQLWSDTIFQGIG